MRGVRVGGRQDRGMAPVRKGRKASFVVAVCLFVALAVASAVAWRCHSRPDAGVVRAVDSLNVCAGLLRHDHPDSAYALAAKAYTLSQDYPDGRSEALCHQMYICFLRMDYATERRLYDELQSFCGNQIELLVGEVNMMMVCQRAAQNRLFYDYYNRALERIRRIMEEYDDVEGRNKERLEYALAEFSLTAATNCLNLLQEEEAERALADIDPEGFIRQDRALRAYFYYLNGLVALSRQGEGGRLLEAFDYLLWAYTLAERDGSTYFRAKAGLALSELFARSGNYASLRPERGMELDYLCRTLVPGEEAGRVMASRLSEALARQSLADAGRCGSLMLEVDGFRALGMALFAREEYQGALDALTGALECLNEHHRTYYPQGGDGRLEVFGDPEAPAVDMEWAQDADVQTLPISLARCRESLSAIFAGLGDKQKSDYNRNLYLDLMDFSRQDKSLESRAAIVARDNRMLHTLSGVVILSAAALCFFLFAYARKWRRRNERQLALLKDMSEWFMDVAFRVRGDDMDKALGAYPWMKKEKRILHEILRPYVDWTEKNRSLAGQMDEERAWLREECLRSGRQIAQEKRKNISKRAKVSLVHAIVPFIDRMLYTVRRMEKTGGRAEGWAYVGELADEINRHNEVLTEWIRMNRGEVEIAVESFPLQDLFSLLEKGEYNFRRAGIRFHVEKTDLWVKADKALTFFMLNTLVDNARKFTPSGGRVDVSAVEVGQAVELAVADTGCGLSAKDVELIRSSKVYDARRIGEGSSQVRAGKGSGFGLMNCKGIIEKYRAAGELFQVCRFDIQSEEGKGSRFSFRLPKGMARTAFMFLWCAAVWMFSTPLAARVATVAGSGGLESATRYADSVYFANVRGDYAHAFRWADSAFACINAYYADSLPEGVQCRRLTTGDYGMEELEWWRAGVDADYYLFMGIRNELAVAALALHDWEAYDFNNRQFSRLYRLLSKDDSLERFYARQREIKAGLSVSLVLLVLMLLAAIVVAYAVYFRRRMLFRFNAMQVLEANHALLDVAGTGDQPDGAGGLVERMLSVVFSRLEELHETYGISLRLFRADGTKAADYSVGGTAYAMATQSLLERACGTEETVADEVTNTQAYPLTLRLEGGRRQCIGALAVNYGNYRMQREDFVFESFIVNYLAILLYESVVQRGREQETVENAGNERQRALYERARLKVQNQILDNCLSTIKHESMYYPSRIKQMLPALEGESDAAARKEKARSLKELVEYYKEIYTLLVAQADRQADMACFRGEKLRLADVVERWKDDAARRVRKSGGPVCVDVDGGVRRDVFLYADATLLQFLLEVLTKEWLERLQGHAGSRLALRVTEEEGGFVRFTLQTPVPIYTPGEARAIFTPDASRYAYLLCKEIVRELDEMNNYRGCRIEMESCGEAGCRIGFTVPKYE